MDLTYRPGARPDTLALRECVIRAATRPGGARYWNLWIRVPRDDSGVPETYCVPVIPGGDYTENGPGGRSWGLREVSPGVWQVSPSVDAGPPWHHTPRLLGVPAGERWAVNPGSP